MLKKYKSRSAKTTIIIVTLVLVVAVSGYFLLRPSPSANNNCEMTALGECLPAGKCVAPNDDIVDCTSLESTDTGKN